MWLLVANNHILKAQKEINVIIEQNKKVNLCKYRGDEIILTIDVGEITPNDRFFGYELGLSYDNTKVKFDKFLPNGTMTEFFDIDKRGMNVITEGNVSTLDVYAVTFSINNSISGDRPLVAFGGKFIGDCNDSALINIDWIEFTDEFTPTISGIENHFIEVDALTDSTLFIQADILDLIDTLKYQQSKNYLLSIDKNNSFLINEFILSFEVGEGFEIGNVNVTTDKIETYLIEKTTNKIEYLIKNSSFEDIENILSLEITNISTEKFHHAKANMKLEILDSCSCITSFDDTHDLIGAYDEPTNVSDYQNFSIKHLDRVIQLSSQNNKLKIIEIFNLLGQKIIQYHSYEQFIEIDLSELKSGIYFLYITNDKTNKIEKLILN